MKKTRERAGRTFHMNEATTGWLTTHVYNGCECDPEDRAQWRVRMYRCNYSAFNGRRWTPSDYSLVGCTKCQKSWRTKAAYVETITHAKPGEWEACFKATVDSNDGAKT